MNSKNNRQNHDFQIAYFLAGSCHTVDGAYALLCELYEDRKLALKSSEASRLRSLAKQLRAQRMLDSADEAEHYEGAADIAELEAFAETTAKNIAAAEAELATIGKCMNHLEPLRRFAHLPLHEAHEAAQHDEWKLELLHRAENQIATSGNMTADLMGTMRMHPAFKSEILPAIEDIVRTLHSPDGKKKLTERLGVRTFQFPLLK